MKPITVKIDDFAINIKKTPPAEKDLNNSTTQLILQNLQVQPEETVLEINPITGIVSLFASHLTGATGKVYLTTPHYNTYQYIKEQLLFNKISNAQVIYTDNLKEIESIQFKTIILNITSQPNKKVLKSLILQSATKLKPTGKLFLAGNKKEGIISLAKFCQKLFKKSEIIQIKKGSRLILFQDFNHAKIKQERENKNIQKINIQGINLKLSTALGVFANGKVDPGTKLLLENIPTQNGDNILDLGCGGGIIGIFVSLANPKRKIYLVDNNISAIHLTQKNLKLNKIKNATVLPGNCLEAVNNISFDTILTNPPFHSSRTKNIDITKEFIIDSYNRLKKKGKFYLVANIFLPYEPIIKNTFGNCQKIVTNNSYKVLSATK